MKTYQERETLIPEAGVSIEMERFYQIRENHVLVLAKGFGGCSGRNYLVDELAKDYNVVTFSPRNSGNSNGHLTVDNFISDFKQVIDRVAQERATAPYAIGHSLAAYSLARILEEKPAVRKGVLLAPLINMSEQNPSFVNHYLERCVKKGELKVPSVLVSVIAKNQRFEGDDLLAFAQSTCNASEVTVSLQSPTYAILAGRGNVSRMRIRNLDKLKQKWESLGAKVDICEKSNHWFSGYGFSGSEGEFQIMEREGLLSKVKDFLIE